MFRSWSSTDTKFAQERLVLEKQLSGVVVNMCCGKVYHFCCYALIVTHYQATAAADKELSRKYKDDMYMARKRITKCNYCKRGVDPIMNEGFTFYPTLLRHLLYYTPGYRA
jgi:hypothetical protein